MSGQQELRTTFQAEMENPLLWPILDVLHKKPLGWKVHTLAAHLNTLGFMPTLDISPEKDLFKRNFLIMNALFQLQETLYPDQWLQVEAMDIELRRIECNFIGNIDHHDPLRQYYTQWQNYEAQDGEVRRLLDEFWSTYRQHIGGVSCGDMSRTQALRLFDLPHDASPALIRKTWRKLALKWHPDRASGNSDRFRVLCEAWHALRDSAPV